MSEGELRDRLNGTLANVLPGAQYDREVTLPQIRELEHWLNYILTDAAVSVGCDDALSRVMGEERGPVEGMTADGSIGTGTFETNK